MVFISIRCVRAAPQPSPSPKGVFREYIGGGGAALTDVPVDKSVEFHFLLAFAVDEAPSGPTNGNFSGFWQPRISPAHVEQIKTKYNNIKVSASLGGGGSTPIFSPKSVSSWLKNAVSSLTTLIKDYSLDGIDIDYETFDYSVTVHDFALCIGELITELKRMKLISMASIAPYPGTDGYYTELWKNYSNVIDYVNYQFYSEGDMSVDNYLSVFDEAKAMYPGGTIIPSFETINNGTAIVPSTGLEACQKLKNSGELHGIFIWSADQSYKDFQYEIGAQSLLAS